MVNLSKNSKVFSDKFKVDFRYVWGISCIVLIATILFKLSVESFNTAFKFSPYISIAMVVFVSLLGIKFKRHDMVKPLQYMFYLCVYVPIFYGLTSYVSYQPQSAEETQTLYSIYILLGVSTICAIASWYRPFLALITLCYLPWRDMMVQQFLGVMPNDRVDWIVLVEMGVFVLFCMALLKICEKYFSKEFLYGKNRGDKINPVKPAETIFIVAICLHLANYFFSLVQKVALDGGPLTWIFENPTHQYIPFAYDRGLFPIANLSSENLFLLNNIVESLVLPLNISVFIAQALAIIALSNKRLLIGLTIFYDLMHIGIFILTGIFFWKWILLNLTIIIAFKYWKHKKLSASFNLACAGFICLTFFFFSVARLGWYDLNAARVTHVIAHYKNGETRFVPTNYFMSYSFRFIFSFDHITPGGFQENVWMNTTLGKGAYKTLVETKTCEMTMGSPTSDPEHERRGINVLKRILKNHHQYVLNHVDQNGYINYDRYPHHVWSDPFAFDDFKYSDKRDIIGFEIINRSICFNFNENGEYAPILKHKDSVYVPIK